MIWVVYSRVFRVFSQWYTDYLRHPEGLRVAITVSLPGKCTTSTLGLLLSATSIFGINKTRGRHTSDIGSRRSTLVGGGTRLLRIHYQLGVTRKAYLKMQLIGGIRENSNDTVAKVTHAQPIAKDSQLLCRKSVERWRDDDQPMHDRILRPDDREVRCPVEWNGVYQYILLSARST